jgi:hypothetical protein
MNFKATPAQVAALMAALKADGATITAGSDHSWLLSDRHVQANMGYVDPDLTVTILSKPFYVTVFALQQGIAEKLAEMPV